MMTLKTLRLARSSEVRRPTTIHETPSMKPMFKILLLSTILCPIQAYSTCRAACQLRCLDRTHLVGPAGCGLGPSYGADLVG
jgi:hypothetical protein